MKLSEKTKELKNYLENNQNVSIVSQSEISKIYQELIDCVTDHNHLYYIENQPIISDSEYDQFFDYIKKIEQEFPYMISWNSPTQKLVNQIQEWFNKSEHKAPMLSLENSYNAKDLQEREERINRILSKSWEDKTITYYVEPKFDGISIELIYEDWIFSKAITRWDWLIWEDVTENVKTIKNIPKALKGQIKWTISFRWEILIWKSELEKINKEREKNWLQIYANTRNLASWSLKQLDPNITASRNLQCFIYEILYANIISTKLIKLAHGEISSTINKDFSQDITVEMTIKNLWLPTYSVIKSSNNIQDIIKICEDPKTKNNLQQEDVDFDWLVIKVEWNNLRRIIWYTEHHPKRAIAYKFPAEQVSTQIKSVEFQVWRTWIITPVANLEPVNLSGATISRVSLHNFDFIKEKDIHQNDFVRLQRSGEVIPYITWVIKERRNNNSQAILPPEHCPSCKTVLTNVDMHYYCQNLECPAQIKEKIIWFVSKECMDIEWIWESVVTVLVDNKIISNISDLYKLLDFETERIVRRFPWFADKKIVEIQKQLQESKNKEFRRLLNGLWIPWIGKKTSKDIANELASMSSSNEQRNITLEVKDIKNNKIWNLEQISKHLTNPEFLISIYGVWEKIIEWIINYRNNNLELLQKLENIGLNFNFIQKTTLESKWNFCITGSFDIPRPEIIKKMEEKWFIFDSSPNKNTKYMLIWSKAWSKLAKAEELWTKIIKTRDNITKAFPFLLEIQINKLKNNWPEQMWLF